MVQIVSACKSLGPGPGAYRMPTTVGFPQHDPTRTRNPMYSMGGPGRPTLHTIGPGPCYRIQGVTRDGNVTSPTYSFGARFPTRPTLRTPGPGAHAPERCPLMRDQRPPQYSMGARTGFMLKRPGPAPNVYMIRFGPGTPAYTMGYKGGLQLKPTSPGPAVYFQKDQNVYKNKYPMFTLGARPPLMGKVRSPGPAAYPRDLYNTKARSYSYSFGTRHGPCAPPMIVQGDALCL